MSDPVDLCVEHDGCALIRSAIGQVAHVSMPDWHRAVVHRWRVGGAGYFMRTAGRRPDRRVELLHRFLLDLSPGDERQVDHVNGDRLDNRRANLRVVTADENRRNRGVSTSAPSPYKGVGYRADSKRRKRWSAHIHASGRLISLGTYLTPEEAARAYDAAARIHHGEFARLNFPQEGTR